MFPIVDREVSILGVLEVLRKLSPLFSLEKPYLDALSCSYAELYFKVWKTQSIQSIKKIKILAIMKGGNDLLDA